MSESGTFICDASGSMINKMAILKSQMRSTIDRLRPTQAFSIFFFKENMESLPKNGVLLLATPDNKRRGPRWQVFRISSMTGSAS